MPAHIYSPPSYVVELHENSNFISFPGLKGPAAPMTAFQPIPSILEHWNTTANLSTMVQIIGEGVWAQWNPVTQDWDGSLENFEIGRGYWVKVTAGTPAFELRWPVNL
jgi:hypothetical protein